MSARFIKARFKTTRPPYSSPVLTLELAHTPEQHAQGLKGRAMLPEHHGMLFIFDKPGHFGFWMKDTGLPLDIAWLSEAGVIQQVALLYPYNERQLTPLKPAKYALELNAGTLRRMDVRVWDQLILGVTT